MKTFGEQPPQEKPGAARMATPEETRDMFLQMGPAEAMRVLNEMKKLAQAGVKRETSMGDVMDELEKRAEE